MATHIKPEDLVQNPELFVRLVEEHGIKPKDLGVKPHYLYMIRKGLRKPSERLARRLVELIGMEERGGARSRLGGPAAPRGRHGDPQRGRLNFRVRYESGCCPAAMAGSGVNKVWVLGV